MRPLLVLTCAATLALAGCAIIIAPNDGDVQLRTVFSKPDVVGDGHLTMERRAVATLPDIDLVGPVQMEVRVGQAPSLQVEADANLLPLVRTDTSGAALRVWVDGSVRTNHAIRVIYTVPQLAQIRATGSGRLLVSDLNGGPLTLIKTGSGTSVLSGRVGNLNLQATGSGDIDAVALQSGNANLSQTGSGAIKLGQVSADSLNVKLRGSGDLQVSGMATQVNARVTGSGSVRLKDLSSERADLATEGSGNITAQAGHALVAQTNGSGRITVYGNPEQRNITGKHVEVLN